ncbi:MAG TPA: heat-inducible transcriptional repressor HrcA [Acidimicrobiales bacterium]|nr:heat-inducible transcriptional repressor HrcA [Acidimicrobiales bacterium]
MLDERKSAILRAVVKEYIETAQPVASAHVARLDDLGVSSATVRNEMAVLEREGYLVHPHTSAGRIPTDKGYRFYVDQLRTPPGPLAPGQKRQVEAFFARAHGELEQMLDDTGRLLTNLTDCAAMVLAPGHEAATVRSFQLVALGSRVALAVMVLSDGAVEKDTIELDADETEARVAVASAHLAAHLVGRTPAGAAPAPFTGDDAIDRLVARAQAAVVGSSGDDHEHVWVGGASRISATFEAIDSVRQVLAILEQQYVVVSLLQDALRHDKLVSIGTEHGVEPLAECSIVVAPYDVSGAPAGTIGVLGPTRMNYPQAMAAVAVVSERLSRRLQEG